MKLNDLRERFTRSPVGSSFLQPNGSFFCAQDIKPPILNRRSLLAAGSSFLGIDLSTGMWWTSIKPPPGTAETFLCSTSPHKSCTDRPHTCRAFQQKENLPNVVEDRYTAKLLDQDAQAFSYPSIMSKYSTVIFLHVIHIQ